MIVSPYIPGQTFDHPNMQSFIPNYGVAAEGEQAEAERVMHRDECAEQEDNQYLLGQYEDGLIYVRLSKGF